jgi:peptidyl-prolyl cis-trans isomerase C
MSRTSLFHKESGNAGIIALVVLVVVAIGAFAYFATQKGNQSVAATDVPAAANTADAGANPAATANASGQPQIAPGNPVVAKVDGKDITRMDVLNFVQTLPPQTRQMPIEQLFPLAVDQLVNTQVIVEKTKGVKLDSDPEVQKQVELAKEQIVRTVYLQKEVEKKVTDARLKEAYELYKKNFPDVQEARARHILVKEESKAKDLIKQLDGGADFAELAKQNSTDGTAPNGGDLGYFTEKDVVPAFGKAAFGTAPGSYTKTPVKSDFGYHIIKVEDKRKRPPAEFEAAKPFLEVQVRRAILEDMIKNWREQAKIETFDINGNKIEPSAGN